jgi:uncharacterized membrane protein YvlD (DUF360 family)
MGRVIYGAGWVAVVIAALLLLLGALTWPPGGLMFALPFFFIIPGVFLAVVGLLLLWIGKRLRTKEARPS